MSAIAQYIERRRKLETDWEADRKQRPPLSDDDAWTEHGRHLEALRELERSCFGEPLVTDGGPVDTTERLWAYVALVAIPVVETLHQAGRDERTELAIVYDHARRLSRPRRPSRTDGGRDNPGHTRANSIPHRASRLRRETAFPGRGLRLSCGGRGRSLPRERPGFFCEASSCPNHYQMALMDATTKAALPKVGGVDRATPSLSASASSGRRCWKP